MKLFDKDWWKQQLYKEHIVELNELQLNELGINTPGRASLAQLERWGAEIQASNDKMTKIKLALRCAEGVMWIWREKYPTDNRPQAALNAVKAYIKDPSEENKQKCAKAADDAYDAYDAAYDDAAAAAAVTAADAAIWADGDAYNAVAVYYAIQAITNYQKEHQLNELGINTPGRASLAQLERWGAEIQASNDKMTKIKLALRCAEGVMWIWREKHPTDNRPQAAINALKNYIKDPSAENAQNCENAAYDAWVAWNVANDATTVAAAAAAAAAVATAADAAIWADADAYNAADAAIWADDDAYNAVAVAGKAIKALINYQRERQLNELGINHPNTSAKELKQPSRKDLIHQFIKFCFQELQIYDKSCKIKLTTDKSKTSTYAHYTPDSKEIIIYTKNRSLGDIMRSLCHEISHFKQDIEGRLKQDSGKTGSDEENEANIQAGIILRKFGKQNPIIFENKISKLQPKINELDIDRPTKDEIFSAYYGRYKFNISKAYNLIKQGDIKIEIKTYPPEIMHFLSHPEFSEANPEKYNQININYNKPLGLIVNFKDENNKNELILIDGNNRTRKAVKEKQKGKYIVIYDPNDVNKILTINNKIPKKLFSDDE